MALNAQQKRRVFEILKVIYADDAYVHNHYRITQRFTTIQELKNAIETYLDSTLDSDSETEVTSLISEWDEVRLLRGRIDGAVGSIQGLQYDPEEDRQAIRELMATYVPYMDLAQSDSYLQGQELKPPTGGGGNWVGVSR